MKITNAILACLLLLANVAMSNAAIIVTTSLLETSALNASTITYRVRSAFTTSNADAFNSAASYGFRVTITSSSAITINSLAGSVPAMGLGNLSPFSHDGTTLNVTSNSVDFIGRSASNQSFVGFGTDVNDVRDLTFSVTRPLSGPNITLTATARGIGYAGASGQLGAAGGNGFVVTPGDGSNIGTAVTPLSSFGNFAAGTASITAVPEPSSVGLLAVAGIFGFGIRMRNWRLKRKSAS